MIRVVDGDTIRVDAAPDPSPERRGFPELEDAEVAAMEAAVREAAQA